MNKRLITYTTLTCATLLAVGATMLGQKSLSIKSYADPIPVDHTIRFTYENVSGSLYEDGFGLAELSKKTDAGNDFSATELYIYYTEPYEPSEGDAEHDYLFKIYQAGWSQEKLYGGAVFELKFSMELDISTSVTAVVNRTIHFDNGSDAPSNSTGNDNMHIDDVDGMIFELEYEFEFTSKYQQYVTINYIEISYSCSY